MEPRPAKKQKLHYGALDLKMDQGGDVSTDSKNINVSGGMYAITISVYACLVV